MYRNGNVTPVFCFGRATTRRAVERVGLVLVCLSFLLGFSACPEDNGDENDLYDPRNVTRIDDHLEVQPELAIDSQGNVHMVYFGGPSYYEPLDVFYVRKNGDGKWSEPVNLSNSNNDSRVPQIAIDSQDNIHVIWEEDGEGNGRTMYTTKYKEGEWTKPEYITYSYNSLPQIGIDGQDNVHVAGDGFRLQYRRKAGGIWLSMESPDTITVMNPIMAVSENGDVFIAAEGGNPNRIELVTRLEDTGLWKREFISDSYAKPWVASVAVGGDGTVYVSWTVAFTDQIKICMKHGDGTWSEIDSIPDIEGDAWRSHLAVDKNGLHVVWNAHTGEWDYDIYYEMRSHEGVWWEREQISFTKSASLDHGIFLNNNVLHIAWAERLSESKYGNWDIYYTTIGMMN